MLVIVELPGSFWGVLVKEQIVQHALCNQKEGRDLYEENKPIVRNKLNLRELDLVQGNKLLNLRRFNIFS